MADWGSPSSGNLQSAAECFDTLLAGTYRNTRFLLIDNASTDTSVAFVRERYGSDPRVEILELPENLGWSRGNNAGIERAMAASADYVFLLNNDTATDADAVEQLVAMAEQHPETGALAPKMLLYSAPAILNSVGIECSIIGSSWDRGIGRLDGPQWDTPVPVLAACGGAAFLRVEALRKAGVLPTDFDIYLDDLDLGLRIWNAGYEILTCPAARVRHKFSATMGQGKAARRKYYLNTRNRTYVILRDFPMSRWPMVKVVFFVGEMRAIGRAILDGAWWRVMAHVRSWFAGMAYMPRAARERVRRWRTGQSRCRFWHLIRKDCMFFRGVPFPEDGWYAPRDGVRPIAACARLEVAAGRLRLVLVNCYPALGTVSIDVLINGQPVARLETLDRDERVLDIPACELVFVARHIFLAEETGEAFDCGGWLAVEGAQERP
ncbi:MAG: glycosyltransferase family 2 protein [Candidatus Hydrogenedentes bacterium]|nr:glycosyltransferase family 2 protein [Candidatus Hydrogenedentota bacterium]